MAGHRGSVARRTVPAAGHCHIHSRRAEFHSGQGDRTPVGDDGHRPARGQRAPGLSARPQREGRGGGGARRHAAGGARAAPQREDAAAARGTGRHRRLRTLQYAAQHQGAHRRHLRARQHTRTDGPVAWCGVERRTDAPGQGALGRRRSLRGPERHDYGERHYGRRAVEHRGGPPGHHTLGRAAVAARRLHAAGAGHGRGASGGRPLRHGSRQLHPAPARAARGRRDLRHAPRRRRRAATAAQRGFSHY